jgi:Cu2+-exporting ATPase
MSVAELIASGAIPRERRPIGASQARRVKPPACRHCGAPLIDARMVETGFCCSGCSYVYRLVHEHGLDGYYQIKDKVTAPADAGVFGARDYGWLEQAQGRAEAADAGIPELTVNVQGISCVACVWLIEKLYQQQAGARDVYVNPQYGSMRMRWVIGAFSAADFARRLQTFGYLIGPADDAAEAELESRALIKRIGLCAAFAMNVMLFSLPTYFGMDRSFEWAGLFGILSLAFGTLSFLVGGTYFVGRAVHALRARVMHIDLPIALGIIGAYAGSVYGWLGGHDRFVYFDFVSTFILLMLTGRWAQTVAVERNRRRLLRHQPRAQRIQRLDGTTASPEDLRVAEVVWIAPGQVIPVEARLDSEHAVCSLASISGEAEPRVFGPGQRLPAGAVNVGRTAVRVTTMQAWRDSLLVQLFAASERPSERHPLLERIVSGYTAGILFLAATAGTVWGLTTGDALRTGAVVTAVLVVSCPCAIGLAFPLADEMATVALRRRGVFVRETSLWARLRRIRKVVFDKTGTLTLETPVLLNPRSLDTVQGEARAALLALVWDNPHPISECLREQLLGGGCPEPLPGRVVETIGIGVELGQWSLGKPGWRAGERVSRLPAEDEAVDAVFARSGVILAEFHFADQLRPDAPSEVAGLRSRGLLVKILSGDRTEKVRKLASELGIDPADALGDLSPHDKAKWMEKHGAADGMMLGDGANDSLAFDCALCRGTPVIHRGVLERKADFYYLGRGISGLRALFEVDQVRHRTQVVMLGFSVVYNLLAVGLAVAGEMNPLIAAILMPANSLLTLAIVTTGMRRAFAAH